MGAKFIGVNGYESSKSGEIADHTINVNVDIGKAKRDDLQTLKTFSKEQLNEISQKVGVSKEIAEKALSELIVSSEKNLKRETATNQSKGQTDNYVHLGKGLKLHKDTFELYVTGFSNQKKVLIEGTYPTVNSNSKTLVKNAIKKTLKMGKFRNFNLGSAEQLNVSGDTIQVRTKFFV
jgi:hypothetical protein